MKVSNTAVCFQFWYMLVLLSVGASHDTLCMIEIPVEGDANHGDEDDSGDQH